MEANEINLLCFKGRRKGLSLCACLCEECGMTNSKTLDGFVTAVVCFLSSRKVFWRHMEMQNSLRNENYLMGFVVKSRCTVWEGSGIASRTLFVRMSFISVFLQQTCGKTAFSKVDQRMLPTHSSHLPFILLSLSYNPFILGSEERGEIKLSANLISMPSSFVSD